LWWQYKLKALINLIFYWNNSLGISIEASVGVDITFDWFGIGLEISFFTLL
jgi:hypothetical protein